MSDKKFKSIDFKSNLAEVTLLTFLKPYLENQALYLAHKDEIKKVLEIFLMQQKKAQEVPDIATPTLTMVLKAIGKNITEDWEIYTKEKQAEVNQHELDLKTISHYISRQYGSEMLTEIEKQIKDPTSDNLVADLTENIADETQKSTLLEHIEQYKAKYQALAAHRAREVQIIESQQKQTSENAKTSEWARVHLMHYHLLCRILEDEHAAAAYTSLLGLAEEKNTTTVLSLLLRPKVTNEEADPAAADNQRHSNLDDKIFNLINTMSLQAGTHMYNRLSDEGNPEYNISTLNNVGILLLAVGIGTLLTVLFLASAATLAPIIPVIAEHGLGSLYTTVFSGLGFVSQHHHFSFGAIYGMSVGFLAVIDIIVGLGMRHFMKELRATHAFNRENLYPAQMEKQTCAFVEKQCSALDQHIDLNIVHVPQRLLLTSYHHTKLRHQPQDLSTQSINASPSRLHVDL